MPTLRNLTAMLNVDDKRAEVWIDKLMLKGIRTFEDFALCDCYAKLSRECQIPFEVLNSWSKWINLKYSKTHIPTLVEEISNVEKQKVYYSFGCNRFDEVFDGIPSGEITQISGDEASGKTQLCHSLAVQAAIKNHSVLYIDTESTFSGERIVNIIKNSTNIPVRELWDKIQVTKIFTIDELFSVLQDHDHSIYSVLIVDSMLGVLIPRVVQLGMIGEMAEQDMVIQEFARTLKSLVIRYPSLAVVVSIGNLKWFCKYWSNVPNLKLHLSIESLNIDNEVVRKIEVQRCTKANIQKSFNFTIQNGGLKDKLA